MSHLSQQEIESWLWESANILRGPVDPANLRDFVFPLLFLKRLSDTWSREKIGQGAQS
jgi:type I restriction enzyme M protein